MDFSQFSSSYSIIIQIIAGIIVTYIIYVLSLFALNADKLAGKGRPDPVEKIMVPITKGVLSSSEIANGSDNNQWNTTLPFMNNYLPLTPSINKQGGAQFSYSFWVYVGNPVAARGKTIFLKGDKKRYNIEKRIKNQNYARYGNDQAYGSPEIVTDRAVYCPWVSFGSENLELDIQFNTFHKMDEKASLRRIQADNNLKRNNLQGLFPNSWFCVTFVFEDNIMVNDFEKGILFRLYINDSLYQINKFNSTLKQNRGDFYLFPDDEPIPNCKIGDLKYYNYALSDAEVRDIVKNKVDVKKNASTTGNTNKDKSFETGLKNHMDIYNI